MSIKCQVVLGEQAMSDEKFCGHTAPKDGCIYCERDALQAEIAAMRAEKEAARAPAAPQLPSPPQPTRAELEDAIASMEWFIKGTERWPSWNDARAIILPRIAELRAQLAKLK